MKVIKPALYIIILLFFILVGFYIFFQLRMPKVYVLCYHKIPKEIFIKQLEVIKKSKINVFSPQSFLDFINQEIPKSGILFTFDDGILDHLKYICPILSEYGYKAIFFVNSSNIGKKNFLNKENIYALVDAGMVIGSHSHHHVDLTRLSEEEIKKELTLFKQSLEKIIQSPVVFLATPYGTCNSKVEKSAFSVNYKIIFSGFGINYFLSPRRTFSRIDMGIVKKAYQLKYLIRFGPFYYYYLVLHHHWREHASR